MTASCLASTEGKRFTSISLPELCQQHAGNNSGSLCVALFHNDVLYSCKHSHVCSMKGLPNINYTRALLVVLTAYLTFVSFHHYTTCQFVINQFSVGKKPISNLLLQFFMLSTQSQSYLLCSYCKVSNLLVTCCFKNCASLIYVKKCAISGFNFRCQYQCNQHNGFDCIVDDVVIVHTKYCRSNFSVSYFLSLSWSRLRQHFAIFALQPFIMTTPQSFIQRKSII